MHHSCSCACIVANINNCLLGHTDMPSWWKYKTDRQREKERNRPQPTPKAGDTQASASKSFAANRANGQCGTADSSQGPSAEAPLCS